MEVRFPLQKTHLVKALLQDYLAGFIPAPWSFGADGICTRSVIWFRNVQDMGCLKGYPQVSCITFAVNIAISGKPVFLRQDVLLSASLHCRMSPYFLNHTSGARRAFWSTTSGMHQKQIGVIFCFFLGPHGLFLPLYKQKAQFEHPTAIRT